MADTALRLDENAAGEWFVDSTCIDCDTCRFVAPKVFERSADTGMSYVARQPVDATRAAMALVACPTSSIGGEKTAARDAAGAFPELIADNVYYCGYASEKSFGASSYFVVDATGNTLVDSPRAAGPLLKRLTELGGIRRMLLSHQDDVADHVKFQEQFGCERVIHKSEARGGLAGVERQLEGDAPIGLGDDWLAIPVPGHTRGSVAYLYREKFLFTGDHLWWSSRLGRLHASRDYCWWDWPRQLKSLRRLLDYRFEWVLPGHGRRFQAESADAMRLALEDAIRQVG